MYVYVYITFIFVILLKLISHLLFINSVLYRGVVHKENSHTFNKEKP